MTTSSSINRSKGPASRGIFLNPELMLLGAVTRTYLWRSRAFFDARRRWILIFFFLLAPAASVPEIPLYPFFAMADVSLNWRVRLVSALVIATAWNVWVGSQEGFFLRKSELHSAFVGVRHVSIYTIGMARFLVELWPVYPLGACLLLLAGASHGIFILGYLMLIIAMSPLCIRCGRMLGGSVFRRCQSASTSVGVLIVQAIGDVSPGVRYANTVRYLASLVVMAVAMLVSSVPGQRLWAPEFLAVGVAVAALPMIWLVQGVEMRTAGIAPTLALCPSMHKLRAICSAVVMLFFLLSSVASGLVTDIWLAVDSGHQSLLMEMVLGVGLCMCLARWLDLRRRADYLALLAPFLLMFATRSS